MIRRPALLAAVLAASTLLVGCGPESDSSTQSATEKTVVNLKGPTKSLQATIKYTSDGVPHITASNMTNAGFASGYVQAKANACILADQFIRVKGERAKYYGPGPTLQAPLSPQFAGKNVVSDFSVKALGFVKHANDIWPSLSKESHNLISGFAAGYNYYLDKTNNLTSIPGRYGKCAGQPWVQPVTAQEVLAYYSMMAEYASGMQFATGATFFAAPGDLQSALPEFVRQTAKTKLPKAQQVALASVSLPSLNMHHLDMGSNGWGISSALTESGLKGALLANPHFPYTGARRLFQLQVSVPSKGYNVNGGAILGVAIPLIGFNNNVAWTHTVSTAHHFTVYQLKLKPGDKMTYIKDGKEHKITTKPITVQVKTSSGLLTFKKDFYYSEYGPMLNLSLLNSSLPAPYAAMKPFQKWGQNNVAYTYRDANAVTASQMMDQWLQMGKAQNLADFQKAFQKDKNGVCSSVLWVNTIYADRDGNAFYIDGTAVPSITPTAQGAYMAKLQNPSLNLTTALLFKSGVTLLDGSTSSTDWQTVQCDNGLVGYARMPQVVANSATQPFVQNSNNSFWLTAADPSWTGIGGTPATGIYSILYGQLGDLQGGITPRTRMGLTMLSAPTNPGASTVAPAGADGKFSAKDVINNLYSNRALYVGRMLPQILPRCAAIGTASVNDPNGARSVAAGCKALVTWSQQSDRAVFNKDSKGAALFRLFVGQYMANNPTPFVTQFDPTQPVATPNTLLPAPSGNASADPVLIALAQAMDVMDGAGVDYDTPLGELQFQQQSKSVAPADLRGSEEAVIKAAMVDGNPIPWGGTQNMEGGFQITRPYIGNVVKDSRYPRISPAGDDIIPNTGDFAKKGVAGPGWYVAFGSSWHFGLAFPADASKPPVAYGLLSYSQSADSGSPHSSDQDKRFSNKDYRQLWYSTQQIKADLQSKVNLKATVVVPNGQ